MGSKFESHQCTLHTHHHTVQVGRETHTGCHPCRKGKAGGAADKGSNHVSMQFDGNEQKWVAKKTTFKSEKGG